MSNSLTVVPSYGRDYGSKKTALADWASGKDFTIYDLFSEYDGRQVNIADLRGTGTVVRIRYKQRTQVCTVKVD